MPRSRSKHSFHRRAPRPDAVFRAVSDPTRRAILDRLLTGDAAAGDVASWFRVSRPAISRHLRVLRGAHLVIERREGRRRIYSADPEPLKSIDDWLTRARLHWAARLIELKEAAEATLPVPQDRRPVILVLPRPENPHDRRAPRP